MALVEEKEREIKCLEDLTDRLNVLVNMCPTETVKDQLMTRLDTKGYDFKIKEHLKREIKLNNLKMSLKKILNHHHLNLRKLKENN